MQVKTRRKTPQGPAITTSIFYVSVFVAFFRQRYRRYRALLLTGNARSIANQLFLLAFYERVTDVTDVTDTFAFGIGVRSSRTVLDVRRS
jgi:hypothetical protein